MSSKAATPPESPDPWVWLARIRRTQGRKGEVFAELLTDFPEKFAERRRLWLVHENVSAAPPHAKSDAQSQARTGAQPLPFPSAREVLLNTHWLHKGGVVLHFEGVDSISAAEELQGLIVAVPRGERVPLPEDEVYISDLIGCALIDVARADAPVVVGKIENVERATGTAPLLIVQGLRGEVLVPFAKSYLRNIDLQAKRVEMELPEGLADLNP